MKTRSWIIIGVVGLVVLLVAVVLARGQAAAVKVDMVSVQRRAISKVVTGSGKVVADRVIPVISTSGGEVRDILVSVGKTVRKDHDVIEVKSGSDAEAPIDGKVAEIRVSEGQKVTPGQVLMTIADMSPTYVIANIDETDIAAVKKKQRVRIVLDAYPDYVVRGKVSSIGLTSTVTEGGGTAFPVKIRVTEIPEGVRLRLGMSADVDVVTKIFRDAVVIPLEAVTSKDDTDVVFVVDGDKVREQRVKLGISTERYYQVLGGLVGGEEIVARDVDKLTDGARIEKWTD